MESKKLSIIRAMLSHIFNVSNCIVLNLNYISLLKMVSNNTFYTKAIANYHGTFSNNTLYTKTKALEKFHFFRNVPQT